MIPPPIAIGLTICEKVILEELTKNVSLLNTFTKLNVATNVLPRFIVYAVLIDGSGTCRVQLSIVELETAEEIYHFRGTAAFVDRLTELRLRFSVNNCSFPRSGKYQVVLLVDDELVAQRSLVVKLIEDQS
jgi:hypothetical protein